MSLVGPLVNPNTLEDRFDRNAFRRTRILRHPVIVTFLLALAGGAYFGRAYLGF